MTDWSGITITDGTDQQGRFSAALEPGYFDVDELMFEELLAMGAEYASVVNYFSLKNEANGTWAEMFHADEAVIMSMILSTNLQRLESEFISISYGQLQDLARFMLDLVFRIDFWFTRLDTCQHKSAKALAQKIATIVEDKLAVELHNIGKVASRAQALSDTEKIDSLSRIWRLSKNGTEQRFPRATVTDIGDPAQLEQQLRSSFYVFFNSISYLKSITPLFLQESMSSQQHNPAIGLFMVFLKLYQKAQRKINTFTQRHLDFYYERVLGITDREFVPERLYLLIEAQAGSGKNLIARNTEFSAGKDPLLNEIVYQAENDLVISPAQVKSLATLQLQQDPLISPESELGYVTRIKSSFPGLLSPNSDQERSISWSLFSAETQQPSKGNAGDACIGFALASPMLLLKEGRRKITLALELEKAGKIDISGMVAAMLSSESEQEFTLLFGEMFAQYLLGRKNCLSIEQKDSLIARARQLLSNRLAADISFLLTQDWQGLFYKLSKEIFSIKLTTAEGWLEVDNYIIEPYAGASAGNKVGLSILLRLDQEVEAIAPYQATIHGGRLESESPILQCYINPQTHFYPYSLFRHLVISALHLSVDVKGVKNVLAYNQHGQLDPSKPFQPFGPLPSSNSYFVFGNYELARKRLIDLKLNLEWGEVPRCFGGFGEYYRGYETAYSNRIFKGEFSALSDGSWQPRDEEARPRVELFEREADSSRLATEKALSVNVLAYGKPCGESIAEDEFDYSLNSRNGFFRLSLVSPAAAFGHAEFPGILTRVLTTNARLKKNEQPPNPPYTPILNSLSVDYQASTTIDLSSRQGGKSAVAEEIIHLHPFGAEKIYPVSMDAPCYLLPQYGHRGNLFIGLSAKELAGRLTLFFHLIDDVSRQGPSDRVVVDWFYLASNTWRALSEKRVLSDTTNGFVKTGVVTLNIPEDINRDNSVMPGEYYWLRASSSQTECSFGNVHSVQTNGLSVVRKKTVDAAPAEKLPEPIKWTALSAVPGVANIEQATAALGGRSAETKSERKVRVSERLRHKNRASLPWDYEHLILESFPDLLKAKCFPIISAAEESLKPGKVLIVVIPKSESDQNDSCKRVMMTSDQLDTIGSYLKSKSSPFADIEVRNPVYEQVQIRCTVKFSDGLSDGIYINRLNREISNYICPWNQGGYKARFGWSIRQQDIESFIRSLSYVDFVTNFSMLHITLDNDGKYSLFDTARDIGENGVVVEPRYPWSLAIPVRKHFIETIKTARSIRAEITGIDELEVGSTFIISGNRGHGEKE